MDAYLATATLGAGMGSGAMLTGWLLREHVLRRACRKGWLVTFGITGRPADLRAQHARLDELHLSANLVGDKAAVLPFPGNRGRAGGSAR